MNARKDRMKLDLILVRHGQTDWNRYDRVMGANPIPLNETGRAQAGKVAEWLALVTVSAIYSSPLVRAVETAQIIAEKQKGVLVTKASEIAEIDYGNWVGLTFSEVRDQHKALYDAYRLTPSRVVIPGGEKVVDVEKRCRQFMEVLKRRHEGQKVLVVSHADVIKTMVVVFLGLPLDHLQKVGCDNGCMAVLRYGTDWGDRVTVLNYFAPAEKVFRNLYTGPSL